MEKTNITRNPPASVEVEIFIHGRLAHDDGDANQIDMSYL